ncbi:MAG: hypothetical protein K8I65_10625, partial [Thermoanaerobaculia bacterium]|nr:hypothetical protein [Thermoanaerobaculia bacterium]
MRGDAAEFQVNVYTTYSQSFPDVAMAPDGRFAVVWQSAGSFDGDGGRSIQARRFDRHGRPLDAREWQVNSLTSANQGRPRVAMDLEGNFVVVWDATTSAGTDSSFASVQARRFRADGAALDEQQFQVNTYTTDDQARPDVAVDLEGNFVVVWQSVGSPGDDQSYYSVVARRYAASGAPLDPVEFQVNTYTSNSQFLPAVSTLPRGGVVITWQSDDDGGGFGRSVKARRFDVNGSPIDPELRVDTLEGFVRREPAVAADPSGGFVVAWETMGGEYQDPTYRVDARRYRPDGMPVSPSEQTASQRVLGRRNRPAIGMGPNGDFVVAWQSYYSPPSDTSLGINARRVRHDDMIIDAEEIQINTYTTDFQDRPSVAVGPDGDFVVVWQSDGSWGDDTSYTSIQARRFPRPVTVVTAENGGSGCSLADAIEAANLGTAVGDCPAGDEGAVLELPLDSRFSIAAPDNGSNALPVVRRPITIRGAGARIERDPGLACPAGPLFRLFEVAEGGTLTLEDVAVSNGCLAAESGAGILAEGGVVVLRGAAIEGNETAGDGGGLAVVDGHLIADGATVRGNLAGGAGGGVVISGPGSSATVRGSTLSANVAVQGGGLWWGAGLPAIVRNSTFSGNASQ